MRSAVREVRQREHIEKLATELRGMNTHLEQRVVKQTAEIRRAYEVEKRARHDLEKLNDSKDQFIMITQHHLRTPVTGIQWDLEAMLSGQYGTVGPELRQAIADTKTGTDRLMRIIDDFLNIAALKAGAHILNLESSSLLPMIREILEELTASIAHKRLTVSCDGGARQWPPVMIDRTKMKEVLLVVIENAVRYNNEGGTIRISASVRNDRFACIVENTGIGISPEEKEKIGSALFYRGSYARKAYPIGMGVGVSVAKAIVRGHHGDFVIDSKGPGTGAKVEISLPMVL